MGLFPPKNKGSEGGEEGVEAETAVAGDDLLCLRVVLRVEHGAFAQQVCRAGVFCAVPGVVFRGENCDRERFPEGFQVTGEFV